MTEPLLIVVYKWQHAMPSGPYREDQQGVKFPYLEDDGIS